MERAKKKSERKIPSQLFFILSLPGNIPDISRRLLDFPEQDLPDTEIQRKKRKIYQALFTLDMLSGTSPWRSLSWRSMMSVILPKSEGIEPPVWSHSVVMFVIWHSCDGRKSEREALMLFRSKSTNERKGRREISGVYAKVKRRWGFLRGARNAPLKSPSREFISRRRNKFRK